MDEHKVVVIGAISFILLVGGFLIYSVVQDNIAGQATFDPNAQNTLKEPLQPQQPVLNFLSCGDSLTNNITLSQDFTCPSLGFEIAKDNIKLDCNGHTIRTATKTVGSVGLRIKANDVEIVNCNIENFDVGIAANILTTPQSGGIATAIAPVERLRLRSNVFNSNGNGVSAALDHSVIENNEVRDSQRGMALSGVNNTFRGNELFTSSTGAELGGRFYLIQDNVFVNNGNGLFVGGEGMSLQANRFANNAFGMVVSQSKDMSFSNGAYLNNTNSIAASDSSNLLFIGNLIASTETGFGFSNVSRTNLTNNWLHHVGTQGVFVNKADDLHLIANNFNNSPSGLFPSLSKSFTVGKGLYLFNVKGGSVFANQFLDLKQAVTVEQSTGTKVLGNSFVNLVEPALELNTSSSVEVTANQFTDLKNGLFISDGVSNSVIFNIFKAIEKKNVFVDKGNNHIVERNIIYVTSSPVVPATIAPGNLGGAPLPGTSPVGTLAPSFSQSERGIEVQNSPSARIRLNVISESLNAIALDNSPNSAIDLNQIENNQFGIHMQKSDGTTVATNKVCDNTIDLQCFTSSGVTGTANLFDDARGCGNVQGQVYWPQLGTDYTTCSTCDKNNLTTCTTEAACLSTGASWDTLTNTCGLKGDTNCNNKVEVADAIDVVRIALGTPVTTCPASSWTADTNCNNNVEAADAIDVVRFAIGSITSFTKQSGGACVVR